MVDKWIETDNLITRSRNKYMRYWSRYQDTDTDFSDYADEYDLADLQKGNCQYGKAEVDLYLTEHPNAKYLNHCVYSHNEYLLKFEEQGQIYYTRVGSDG